MVRTIWTAVGRLPTRSYFVLLISLTFAPLLYVSYRVASAGRWSDAALVAGASIVGLVLVSASRLQRAKVERALSARQLHTQAILDASADAYVAMNAEGRITAWSGQATQTFGWTAGEAIGRTVSELIIPPDLRAGHDGGLERYLATGYGPVLGTRVEVEALHRDGRRFPIELAVWKAEDDQGPIFVSFIHDITDRRRKEAEYAAARDKAMEASRLKSEFVANMSHEIRTPMNGVIGMTDLMARTRLTAEQQEYLSTIRHSADALLDIINDILDFSKIEAGKLQLDERDFELCDIFDEVGALLAGTAHAKGVELVVDVDASVPAVVRGDAGRLRQVLLNVAANAVKFTDVGEVVLSVTLDAPTPDAPIRFTVRDTGPGISQQNLAVLFESFSQGDTSSTRRHGGTGLGLAISKHLVGLMGGQIGVHSQPGEGSEFWFTVRLPAAPEAQPPVSACLGALKGLRVLVVDDNATARASLERTLGSWGMVPTATASADEAMTALQAADAAGQPFAVALIDQSMPGLDGAQLAQVMTGDDRFAGTARILLTSSGSPVNITDGTLSRYLTKPVRRSALLDCLAEVTTNGQPSITAPSRDIERPDERPERAGSILLAEDNAVNQSVGRRMLEVLGYDVDVVSNGAEAVAAVARGSYAAVLMDCQMPVLDGYEASKAIRHNENPGARVPIIAMTANAMEGDAERCLAAGMDDYLAKPVRTEQLRKTLDTWVPAGAATPAPMAAGERLHPS